MATPTSFSQRSNRRRRLAIVACCAAFVALAAFLYSVPALSKRTPHEARACGSELRPAAVGAFRPFTRAVRELNFGTLFHAGRSNFGHAFTQRIPLRRIAEQLSIYGYDYIGTYEDYALFYRRPEAWFGAAALPRLSAPSGELLPPVSLPADLVPEWPSPEILEQTPPFLGAIVLPQQIIAYPCNS